MRALVTGGGGFVGAWLVAHLRDEGDEVVSVDREVDVTDATAVRQVVDEVAPHAIYHLAALAHVGQSWLEPEAVVEVNTLGTLSVVEAARRQAAAPTVLLTSSAEVYGPVPLERQPIGEDEPLAPVTPYAASKVAAEYLALQAHLAHGLPLIRVRPFNHIGPGQGPQFVVPALAARIVDAVRHQRGAISVGNLQARRDLTDVRDVVRAYRLLVCQGSPGAVYNVCSGTTVAIADVAARLLQLAGADLRLVPDPDLVRPVDVPVVQGDARRLREATGWQPQIDLDTTLSEILADARCREAGSGETGSA